jgi:F0F1-type ATP synthase assembly protein I
MPGTKKHRRGWVRLSGIGVEFAAAVVGLTLVGFWIGRGMGHGRGGLLIGALLGIVGGGYNLIRQSLSAMKEAEQQDKRDDDTDS